MSLHKSSNGSKITTMKATLVTIKITIKALRLLRIIAAMTGEKQYEVIDRLVESEMERLKDNDGKQ